MLLWTSLPSNTSMILVLGVASLYDLFASAMPTSSKTGTWWKQHVVSCEMHVGKRGETDERIRWKLRSQESEED